MRVDLKRNHLCMREVTRVKLHNLKDPIKEVKNHQPQEASRARQQRVTNQRQSLALNQENQPKTMMKWERTLAKMMMKQELTLRQTIHKLGAVLTL